MSEQIDFDFIKNAAFPKGEQGNEILNRMNESHYNLTKWGFNHVKFGENILDIGCGGGAAIEQLSKIYPSSLIYGCDVSPISVEATCTRNEALLSQGRLNVKKCGVSNLSFEDETFESVYSIESLYFWPNQQEDLKEVFRVLKYGGTFMTALEMVGGSMNERSTAIAEHLNMNCPSGDELKILLEKAGFSDIHIDHNLENGWLCATAVKSIIKI